VIMLRYPIGVANIQRRLQALEHTFYDCVVCSREFSYAHKGEADVKRHISTKTQTKFRHTLNFDFFYLH
jgi:hypothetical protein